MLIKDQMTALKKRALDASHSFRARFRPQPSRPIEPEFREFSSHAEFLHYLDQEKIELGRRARITQAAIKEDSTYYVPGFCAACDRRAEFLMDRRFGTFVDGEFRPNWRERLVCACGLNNRVRAAVHVFRRYGRPGLSDPLYITEQTTALYRWLTEHFTNVIGSEYFGTSIPFGATNEKGLRNESVTRLSFPDEAFVHILSFDVLEHVPDYESALAELARVLRPGGQLFFTVPFIRTREDTLIRARLTTGGDVEFLEEPEYHGDPLSSDGCLCFYHFGWDLLDACRRAGFSSAKVVSVWSAEYGYLGPDQLLMIARK